MSLNLILKFFNIKRLISINLMNIYFTLFNVKSEKREKTRQKGSKFLFLDFEKEIRTELKKKSFTFFTTQKQKQIKICKYLIIK